MKPKLAYALIGLAFLLLIGGTLFLNGCEPIQNQPNQQGSHGFRIWSGQDFKSFAHGVRSTCIPKGWKAVGAITAGDGWARYQNGMTGVIIDPSAFASTTMTFTHSSYRVTLLYPHTMDAATLKPFESAITNAFERTGAEFNDSNQNSPREHTVVITAGLGAGPNESDAVYPDPGPSVSFFILPPSHPRGEEFFIHAISHLYNRHQDSTRLSYQTHQQPLPQDNWQELEATWAETAFRTSNADRLARLEYLYNVHTAVQTDNYSLITQYPFNDKAAFEKIHHTVLIGDNPPFLDDQYGFYVLTPLATVATEGLLQKYKTGTDIETIFTKLHNGTATNYFDELGKHLPPEAIVEIKSWYFGGKTVPHDLVLLGGAYYEKSKSN